jgi:hypothetical protein
LDFLLFSITRAGVEPPPEPKQGVTRWFGVPLPRTRKLQGEGTLQQQCEKNPPIKWEIQPTNNEGGDNSNRNRGFLV